MSEHEQLLGELMNTPRGRALRVFAWVLGLLGPVVGGLVAAAVIWGSSQQVQAEHTTHFISVDRKIERVEQAVSDMQSAFVGFSAGQEDLREAAGYKRRPVWHPKPPKLD